ncbi:MAG: hypothetical protein NWR72_00650 [Bacteroidia bacterium]|nr:hypothetical protein [Bacteroidia bacterium]
MKTNIILSLLALALCLPALAQTPQEGRYEFYKKIAPAAPGLTFTYDADPATVEAALAERLSSATTKKPEKVKGTLAVYTGLVFPPIASQTLDYYVQLDEIGGNPTKTKLTWFMALGNDNFISSANFPTEMAAASNFLVSLQQDINRSLLRVAAEEALATLEAQEKVVKDLEKAKEDLEKEKQKLEDELAENKKSTEKNADALSEAKAKLVELRSTVQGLRKDMQSLERP